jgi:hypothetical protein
MANTLTDTVPAASAAGLPFWKRVREYLLEVSPKWVSKLFAYGLAKAAAWAALAFLVVLLLPHLSVWSVSFVSWVLPEPAGKAVRDAYVTGIHKGYDIDKVREQLKDEASKDALAKLQTNNESLDYVQYVEFYLARGDQAKEIPASLRLEQRAKIVVRRSQVVRLADAGDVACAVTEVGTSEPVLDVQLDGMRVASLPAMSSPGRLGEINLSKRWWAENLKKAQAEPTIADNIASVRFGKAPAFEQRMTPCTALKVEATVEVFKRDVGS